MHNNGHRVVADVIVVATAVFRAIALDIPD
jgi:hypothetical protein